MQIIERLTQISSRGEWDFYDESLSSPRSRLSLKPARNNILIALMDDSLQEYGLLVRMYCMRGKPFHQRDIVSSQEPCFLGCQCHNSWKKRSKQEYILEYKFPWHIVKLWLSKTNAIFELHILLLQTFRRWDRPLNNQNRPGKCD